MDDGEEIENVKPEETIQYLRPMCDTSGRYCHEEICRIEATITNIILPMDKKKLYTILHKTGRAVADNLMNLGHKMPSRENLIQIYGK